MQKQKLDNESMDLVADNINKLKQIFPDVFNEGQINFEKLQAVLGEHINEDEEHYKFTWHGKKKAEYEATKTRSNGTLRPVKTESKNWNDTNNVFIEGDNLEVLKLLQKSYHNKIKMIYIDPPYNTGKDFVYKDNYKDSLKNYKEITGQIDSDGNVISSNTDKNGRYHTDWLNMMYPRLKLARNLLKDDGVIFISIDDNEQANLKKLCDEIFGEDNRLIDTIWLKGNAQNDAEYIQKNHEYLLGYIKKDLNIRSTKLIKEKVHKDNKGFFTLGSGITTGGAGGTLNKRPNLGYSIYLNEKTNEFMAIEDYDKELAKYLNNEEEVYQTDTSLLNNGYNKIIRAPKKGNNLGRWTWSFENFNKNKDLIFISKNYSIYKKQYLNKLEISSIIDGYISREKTEPPKSFVNISSGEGSKYINSILSHKVFDNPKPIPILTYLIRIISKSEPDIILDFFAGSGTTGDAVMQLNAEDGGNRKYICVQLDEPISEKDNKEAYKFCSDNGFRPVISSITKERLRRAGNKIITDKTNELKELLDKKRPDEEKINQKNHELAKILGLNENVVLSSVKNGYKMALNPSVGLDIGFKVFSLDNSNIKPWDGSIGSFDDLFKDVDNIKENRSKEDVLFEILLKLGLELTVPIEEINCNDSILYNVGAGSLLICLDNINDEIVKNIINIKKETENDELKVVFKDNVFENDVAKTNYSQQLESSGIKNIQVI